MVRELPESTLSKYVLNNYWVVQDISDRTVQLKHEPNQDPKRSFTARVELPNMWVEKAYKEGRLTQLYIK